MAKNYLKNVLFNLKYIYVYIYINLINIINFIFMFINLDFYTILQIVTFCKLCPFV